jgi:hypothetical protein
LWAVIASLAMPLSFEGLPAFSLAHWVDGNPLW